MCAYRQQFFRNANQMIFLTVFESQPSPSALPSVGIENDLANQDNHINQVNLNQVILNQLYLNPYVRK